MKIFITGGTGYLGSRLVRKFLSQGHQVLCLKRKTSDTRNLSDLLDSISFADAEDGDLAERIGAFRPQAAVHTACAYERGGNTVGDVFDANLSVPFAVMQDALAGGVERWINASTALPPFLNSYSLSKYQFSEWGRYFAQGKNIAFINLQLEHFYGKHAPETNFLSWVVRRLKSNESLDLTDGTQKRDFVYVNDVVDVFSAMLKIPLEGYRDVPVGTGISPSIREVVEYLRRAAHSKSVLNFGAVPSRNNEPDGACDTSALRAFGLGCPGFWKDKMKELLEED